MIPRAIIAAGVAAITACRSEPAHVVAPAPVEASVQIAPSELPRQIKDARYLGVPPSDGAYALSETAISIDGREIPLTGGGPRDAIAGAIAHVPRDLRALIRTLVVSPVASPLDALYTKRYAMRVLAGMTAGASGVVTIYPHGIDELRDDGVFARNLLHELGHVWSRQAWRDDPAAIEAWLAAIASDPAAPSYYATASFHASGTADEDAAEATALYFLVRDTPRYEHYRAAMPARFALLVARFRDTLHR